MKVGRRTVKQTHLFPPCPPEDGCPRLGFDSDIMAPSDQTSRSRKRLPNRPPRAATTAAPFASDFVCTGGHPLGQERRTAYRHCPATEIRQGIAATSRLFQVQSQYSLPGRDRVDPYDHAIWHILPQPGPPRNGERNICCLELLHIPLASQNRD